MLHTLSEARSFVRQFVDSGSCNQERIDQRINEALERLMDAHDYACLRKLVRIKVCNKTFPLPYNVEKIIDCTIDATPAKVFGTSYQFLSSGLGDMDFRSTGSIYKDLVDRGDDWPVQFDVPVIYTVDGTDVEPDGMKLIALSPESVDKGKTITIRGFTSGNDEVGGGAGEDIEINQWSGTEGTLAAPLATSYTYSTNEFTDVTRVIKPATTGYVTLYAVDLVNNYFFFLAKYHPEQLVPQFRRYNITNQVLNSVSAVMAQVKLRHVTLSAEDDILPIDSLQALKLMVMAIGRENAGNLQDAMNYEAAARNVMEGREQSRQTQGGMSIVYNVDYRTSLGRGMNRGRLL